MEWNVPIGEETYFGSENPQSVRNFNILRPLNANGGDSRRLVAVAEFVRIQSLNDVAASMGLSRRQPEETADCKRKRTTEAQWAQRGTLRTTDCTDDTD